MDTAKLKASCEETREVAAKAIDWFASETANEDILANRRILEKKFRKYTNEAATLSRAVERPMCVGLFGESQAGKSYLAGGLSRNGRKPLKVVFSGEEDKDFLAQINPDGNKESTGIVTRFSIRPIPHPPEFPVCLRLLSETDLVKILGNSFFFDTDPAYLQENMLSKEGLDAILGKARSRAQATPSEGTSVEQIWGLQDYFQKQFGHFSTFQTLSDYWAEAEELAPKLDPEGRAILFSPLWGAYDQLTELFLSLTKALESLGYAGEAFTKIDALIPRSKSIIDVETLLGLKDPDAEKLLIATMSGASVSLDRPTITALTSELHLVIKEKSWDFFENSDLLDFPGARNRDPIEMGKFLETNEDALKQLLVRGKVAFLFDRYVAEQELTSMLLVLKPSNQNITSLPKLISEWIDRTHGSTPQDRDGRPVLLFLIFSWFNEEIKEKPGEDDPHNNPGERFASRMVATFNNFFGKSHNWPDEWSHLKRFQNSFWLRDPNFSKETFEPDDNEGGEKGVKPSEADRIKRLREAYLHVEEIQRYFQSPQEAWDAAMIENDGGVSRLANSLAPVSEPNMKRRQVAARLSELRRDMKAELSPYHISDDLTKRRDERRDVIDEVLDSINVAADARAFGRVLKVLQINEGALQDHLYRSSRKKPERREEQAAAPRPKRDRFGRRGAGSAEANVSSPQPTRDKAREVAEDIVGAWTDLISERVQSERIATELHFTNAHFKELVAELTGAARRLDLADRIADRIRNFSFPETPESALQRNAVIGVREVNAFVSTLGFKLIESGKRPTRPHVSGNEKMIFSAPAFASSRIELHDEANPPEDDLIGDWGYGLMALADDNAASMEGQNIDLERNAALGTIIGALSAEAS